MEDGERKTFGREERRLALLRASLVIVAVGAGDTALGAGLGPRAAVWAGWAAAYLLAAVATGHGPDWVPRAVGAASSLLAVAATLALAALGGGTRSPFFLVLPMLPLMSALVAHADLLTPALQGAVAIAGGAWLLRLEQRGLDEVAVWAGTAAAATAYALGAARRARQRQEAHLLALSERAAAQAMLAEAERRRGEAERWVAAGHLADQVAHDVNSPLASLRANLAFSREELVAAGADPEVLQAIRDGEEATEEIRGAVSSLKVRTLPPPARKEPGAD